MENTVSVRIGEIFTPDIAEWCEPLGTWSEVGYSLSTGEGFMTDGDWWEWCEAVRVAADEFGAWFVLGRSTDADLFVLQVAPVKGVALSYTLRRHNIREARFFAMLGHSAGA